MLVIIFTTVVVVSGAPITDNSSATVLEHVYEHLPDNGYHYAYKLSDGQFRDETGTFNKVGDELLLEITGSYGYIGEDGKLFKVRYTGGADVSKKFTMKSFYFI